ncbi:Inactive transglutaminase fused to 7 transmembrane helices [Microbulbifer donghaiensis]|uniref:Inactive transglutaminase fused to 7 transmembrane helices n=1 Tax=Microbulbifer donghaiensis TaxID=494016 RepID=A0A1M5CEB3_9GAMM|nr:inactive transglutaminase family protein [Microbulbifer donghaiensis]SHF52937.1 Inactive transglutaminase fused to 7 transmembrane helices [Microbulbifer donghaiensis]
MSPRAQVYILAALLALMGAGLTIYKNRELGFPLLPGEYRTVWTIEAKVRFNADGGPVKAALTLPREQRNMEILGETFSSSGYGFNIVRENDEYRAVWSRRSASGAQSLFYQLDVHQTPGAPLEQPLDLSTEVRKPFLEAREQEAVRLAIYSLVENAHERSSDPRTLTTQILTALADKGNQDRNLIFGYYKDRSLVDVALIVLAAADIPAHRIRGLYLEDDRRRLDPEDLLEVYDGKRWVVFEPTSGSPGVPKNFFIWQRGGKSLLDVEGGRNSQVTFSVIANDVPARDVSMLSTSKEKEALVDFSIYSLPIEQQSIFKLILLVPVGALVVVLLRVFVGLRTSGTFMPVLLAIAFIETQLFTGLSIFTLILVLGLWVRFYLSRLNLLLVARIAAVVVTVVILMGAISVISYKLGIEQALTVTFFPMIILAWTIERMSIVWEEDGPYEVVVQAGGSLLVAVLAWWVMTNSYIEHWTFNFPELLLVLLALILVIGNYTGYRLGELMRFRQLVR